MKFTEKETIRFLTFDALEHNGVKHAIFTRQGGVSPKPWASLNVGGTVGDEPARVRQNQRKALRALGVSRASIFEVWQVHSAEVVWTDQPRDDGQPYQKGDVILTDRPGVNLFMRFADCVPILLYDPGKHVAGLAHAGWQGTIKRVGPAAVRAMQSRYGSKPEDILAVIGPSIGPDHYEVGPEVVRQVEESFQAKANTVLKRKNGGVYFDLWHANRMLLQECGIQQVEVASICTACHLEDWFSHRGENGRTGRFGVLIGLAE